MKSLNLGLQGKVTVAIAALVAVVLASLFSFNIYTQQNFLRQQFQASTADLAEAVYNAILFPMTVNDTDTIRQQMSDFGKNPQALQVLVFGFDKKITYASEKDKAATDLTGLISSPELGEAVNQLIKDGKTGEESYEDRLKTNRCVTVVRPLLNEARCHHCHGTSRSVLGGVMVKQNSEELYRDLASLRNKSILWGLVGGLAIILSLSFMISRLATTPLRRIADGLLHVGERAAASANHLLDASQQLAKGASEQAAAIEETSQSLEEMSSMTRQNADSANQANELRKQMGGMLQEADRSMADLAQAMNEIATASSETQKIIKTIDEIAFQTNLLALNAAVEAARAGEAGAGFAVVADEVRNLAMRAAEAARNTNTLIEGTAARIQRGSDLAIATSRTFASASSASLKVGELIAEIASASNEQAQGIEQINTAVGEMDKVVQQNAANAEESTSASDETSVQAQQVRGYAHELMALMNGDNGRDPAGSVKPDHPPAPGKAKAGVPAGVPGTAPKACAETNRFESWNPGPRFQNEVSPNAAKVGSSPPPSPF